MGDIFELTIYNKQTLISKDFYDKTHFNLNYMQRKLFQVKKNGIEYNSHFPMEEYKNSINFYSCYISAFTEEYLQDRDIDFETGFQNVEYNFEKNLLKELSNKDYKVYYILKNKKELRSLLEQSTRCNPFENQAIGEYFIADDSSINESNIRELKLAGYIVKKNDNKNINLTNIKTLNDLQTVFMLLEDSEVVISRVEYYGNYNLILYTKGLIEQDLILKEIRNFSSHDILVKVKD